MNPPGAPVRVLHLIDGSGYYEHFRVFARHADRTRFDVTFASVAPRGRLHDDAAEWGLPSLALGATNRRALLPATVRLARHLRANRVDVLQTHLFEAGLVGGVAGRLARTPLIVATAHHPHEVLLLGRTRVRVADELANRRLAHRVISPTSWMADELAHGEHVPRDHIAVILHGVELDRITERPGGRDRVRNELGLKDRTVLGSIGRLHPIKGHEILLRSFARVVPTHDDVTLLIVGAGDQASLRSLAAHLGLDGRVVFSGLRKDMGDVLAAIDVVVQPALAESYGLAVVEAMAVGKPVISSTVGVAGDVLTHGTSGMLVAPGDETALAGALSEMFGNRSRWPAMGAAAKRAVAHLRPEAMVRAHEAVHLAWLQELGHGRGEAGR